MCSDNIVVTTLDCRPEDPWFKWMQMFDEARLSALGLPKPSSFWGRSCTLGTSLVEHQDSDWVRIQ